MKKKILNFRGGGRVSALFRFSARIISPRFEVAKLPLPLFSPHNKQASKDLIHDSIEQDVGLDLSLGEHQHQRSQRHREGIS